MPQSLGERAAPVVGFHRRGYRGEPLHHPLAKGLSRRYLLLRHALRPASLGLLNVIGLNIATLLSGTVLVEFIFGLPGLGQLILGASINRDLYLLLAVTTYVVFVYVTLNTIVDIAMRRIDPRLPKPRAFWHRFIGL